MLIQTQRGRLALEGGALIITNTATNERLCISQADDFVLYLGEREDMRAVSSSEFALKERCAKGTIVREYVKDGLRVLVTYACEGETFVKRVSLKSETPVKLCKICLLNGASSLPVSRGCEGQPVFFGGGFWGGIEFPAALNYHENDVLYFMQAPYESTIDFVSFPVVFGLDSCGCLEASFNAYIGKKSIAKRGIRVYGDWGLHDELSGGAALDESLTYSAIDSVKELNERYGTGIEYYLMDAFWFEEEQPYIDFKKRTFPNGAEGVVKYVEENGMKFGLWFDLSMIHAHMKDMEKYSAELKNGALCFACDEVALLMKRAMLYHIEKHHVKMFKLDFVFFECCNRAHDHSMQISESKEKSVKNFLSIVAEIKAKYPDTVFLCYNGWTTRLDWIGCVKKRLGYAVSPYWAQYVDYVYCGDPRPSEIATHSLTDSLCYYTDAMIRNFRDAGMPFEAIDDHGTMLGNTPTIYGQSKDLIRLGWLMNAMRGTYKMQLYGDTSELDDGDKEYIAYVVGLFGEIVNRRFRTEFILGDARCEQVYGYNVHGDAEGYAVIVNPTPKETVQFVKVCDEPIAGSLIIRDGTLTREELVCAEGGFTVSVRPFGYALVKWNSVPVCRRRQKIWLSAGESVSVPVNGAKAFSLTFTDGKKPLRTARGLPEGVAVTADGKATVCTVKQDIWSGISWIYVDLHGEKEIKISYTGDKPVTVKYEFYGETT